MDFIDRLTGNAFQTVRPDTLLKFTNLTPQVQKHLQRVYLTLSCALVLSALGCLVDVTYHIGGLLTLLGAFSSMVGLAMTSTTPQTLNKRYGLLAVFSFCQGVSLGPLVGAALAYAPSLLFTAFLSTATIFVCFSLAALLTNRRAYLFLGGWLSSALASFAMLRLTSWMLGGSALYFQAELYVGLLVFSGYVLFDTQLIVEKAYAGQTDHVKHALDLLVDVLAIFVRILVILLKNAEKRQEEERRKKRRN